jgi:hypothetical protein
MKPFAYRDKGSMATTGHLQAVTDSCGLKFTGVAGGRTGDSGTCFYLVGWGNGLAAVFSCARPDLH